MAGARTTSEVMDEFGGRNPLMPVLKPACDGFEAILMFAVIAAVLGAGVLAFVLVELRG